MNLDDYEKKHFSNYQAFAQTVRSILEKALQRAPELPRPQSIQCRAKEVESVRRRLEEAGKLDTQTAELERRDLAGARIIFYTNNDVDRFLVSSVIRENFEVEEDSTKIHHPVPENEGARYRAVHYTIRLREERTRLPEYAQFAGLRCEIQVQTILNHAWSETSHDILYKNKLGDSFGSKAMEGIARRFQRIMDKYLLPAGFEIQKAQQEYERVRQGKELFDKDIAKLLDNAQNNNERYEILSGLRDYAIPNYNNLAVAYDGLKGPLVRAAKAARATKPASIKTTYGNMGGFDASAVTGLVVEIMQRLRYVDPVGTLQLLIEIYGGEPNVEIRKEIVNVVKNLAEYNIGAYKQVGPSIQVALLDHLATMSSAELDAVRPIATTVWTEALQSDITGTEWHAESMVLSTGALLVSPALREVRDKAIKALFAAYDRTVNDVEKREVLSALDAATRVPSQARYSNELLGMTIDDATRIVEFLTERAKSESYELLQHAEHGLLYDYFRAKTVADDHENRFGCQDKATALVAAILKFRDVANSDQRFVQYKLLVGFESVYPQHWLKEDIDFKSIDEYRHREVDRYVAEIDHANESYWFDLVTRCAATKSDDGATFPVFGSFVGKLAERQPETAHRFLAKASDDLRGFLPGFLNGFARSGHSDIYERVLEDELQSARNLPGVVHHLRYSELSKPAYVRRLLSRAIDDDKLDAVIGCLLFALEHYGSERIENAAAFVDDALNYLNDQKDPRWVSGAWFLKTSGAFFEQLTLQTAAKILQNLSHLRKIDYRAERILGPLARRFPDAVWDYFGDRLVAEQSGDDATERYRAVPFQFHGLEKELSRHPQLAISKGMSWFKRDPKLFQFGGGRLIHNAFPQCSQEFAAELSALVRGGGDAEVKFSLAILQNYEGAVATHIVLREIVSRFSNDASKMRQVKLAIESTGVVTGELGFANAWRARRDALTEWLTDNREGVKEFATQFISELDSMIIAEQRRAESDKEMRKRDYGDDDLPEEDDEGKSED